MFGSTIRSILKDIIEMAHLASNDYLQAAFLGSKVNNPRPTRSGALLHLALLPEIVVNWLCFGRLEEFRTVSSAIAIEAWTLNVARLAAVKRNLIEVVFESDNEVEL